jgi:flagellar biosynthesis/type III secretory pathway chaperone
MLSDAFHQLFANLQASCKLYSRLVEVAERKKQHIVGNDVEGLREDLKAEEQLAATGTELELQRRALHARCVVASASNARTLLRLCDALAEPWKGRFLKARRELRESVERVHELNGVNVALVNNSLDLMNGLLAAMYDTEQTAAYGRSGIRVGAELPHRTLEIGA